MTIKNKVIIPALPDTWKIDAGSSFKNGLGEAIRSQVIAWVITEANEEEIEHGPYRVHAITAFDAAFHDVIESDDQYTLVCDGKNMSPDNSEGEMYKDVINELG